MTVEISGTPWPMRFTAAEPARSRQRLPSASHRYTPSPRTATGNSFRKERRKTELRMRGAAESVTTCIMSFEEASSEGSNRKDDNFELDVMPVSFYIGSASS